MNDNDTLCEVRIMNSVQFGCFLQISDQSAVLSIRFTQFNLFQQQKYVVYDIYTFRDTSDNTEPIVLVFIIYMKKIAFCLHAFDSNQSI